MIDIENEKIVTYDVDDTLVMWKGTEYTPNQKHVNSLKRHYKRGHFIIVWSQGGVFWAKKVVQELGLESMVDMVMAKPSWYVDDKPADEWMERYYYGKEEKDNVGIRISDTGST